jgi:hypothetical protein
LFLADFEPLLGDAAAVFVFGRGHGFSTYGSQ